MTPGQCPYELRTIRYGKLKTCCTARGSEIWTECREWGKCNWDGYDIEPPERCDDEPDASETERNAANVSETERNATKRSEPEQMSLW